MIKLKITEVIEEVVTLTKENSRGYIELDENTYIEGEWTHPEGDYNNDIIEIYFYQNGRLVFDYQVPETLIVNVFE